MKITKQQLKQLIKEVYDEHIDNYSPEMSADDTSGYGRFFDVVNRDSERVEMEDVTVYQLFRWLDENPEYSETVPPEDYADKSNNIIWVTTDQDPHTITDDLPQGPEDEEIDPEVQNSQDAIEANEQPGKMTFDEWIDHMGGPSAFAPEENAYDLWLDYSHPSRDPEGGLDSNAANDDWHDDDHETLADKKFADREAYEEYDEDQEIFDASFMSESFQFDKFIKDISIREEKIMQHKKELTENPDEDNKRERQKLYQEKWQNSVKFSKR